MAQGALGAAGVRRVGYGMEVGRSVRTAGGEGAYCVATRTACFYCILLSIQRTRLVCGAFWCNEE